MLLSYFWVKQIPVGIDIVFVSIRYGDVDSSLLDRPNPRVGADHGVGFDWSRQSRDCPEVSAKILNSDYSAQHCSMYREL